MNMHVKSILLGSTNWAKIAIECQAFPPVMGHNYS